MSTYFFAALYVLVLTVTLVPTVTIVDRKISDVRTWPGVDLHLVRSSTCGYRPVKQTRSNSAHRLHNAHLSTSLESADDS